MTDTDTGTEGYETFLGELTFLRAPLTKDLGGVDVAALGIPYDMGTTNRPGARFGPRAIREQSSLVGDYDMGVWPWDYDVREKYRIIDYGDVQNFTASTDAMITETEKTADRILQSGASLLGLGGDHFVALPLLRAHARKHGPLALVHFDAHSDTWVSEDYDHGTMFYHALREGLIDPDHSVHIGIRTPNAETHGIQIIDAIEMETMSPDAIGAAIRKRVGDAKAYLTFDIDFLDPAFAPGTGTPVVGGPSVMTARRVLISLRGMNIVGGDQVEVAPAYDPLGGITALAGTTIAADILYLIAEARKPAS